jgi:hypothetical protein
MSYDNQKSYSKWLTASTSRVMSTQTHSRNQLWAKGAPQKFSDYRVYKRKCFNEFNISLKFFKIEFKID